MYLFYFSAAQGVNILIGIAVFCTFGLQFYVCIDIVWTAIKKRYANNATAAQFIMRTVMTVVCVSIAIAVPTIIPFVSLIGAFCFSILGLIVPVIIEMLTFWEKGFGKWNWKLIKNFIVIVIALLALIFGSKSAIADIIHLYLPTAQSDVSLNNTLLVLTNTTTEPTLITTTTL